MRISGTTPPFLSTIGLKQGCPLSPTLFGLYIDDFEKELLSHANAGTLQLPQLLHAPVPPLLYADDLTLIALSAAGLQAQLDVLQEYASKWGLTVSLVKTEVVVFNNGTQGPPLKLVYAGTLITVSTSFVYLGFCFHANGSLSEPAAQHRLGKARCSLYAMRSRASGVGIHDPGISVDLFGAIVRPTLEYGVEIWGAEFLVHATQAATDGHTACNAFYMKFLRKVLGVRQGTPYAVLLTELGLKPLWCHWHDLISRYWHRVGGLSDDRLVKQAALCSLKLAAQRTLNAPPKKLPWVAQVRRMFLRYSGSLSGKTPPSQPWLPKPFMVERAAWQNHRQWLLQGTQRKVKDYFALHHAGTIPTTPARAPYLKLQNRAERVALARFRTASHNLMVEQGRAQKVPRAQRFCPLCRRLEVLVVEDETHMLFDCPTYSNIRESHADLMEALATKTVAAFLAQDNQGGIAQFLRKCEIRRTQL